MEEVLEVYHCPRDPACPMVCLDETSKQLIKETRVPIAARPRRSATTDYEYKRKGTANIFMLFAPLNGWRHVAVTNRHAAAYYAHLLKDVSDRWLPDAAKIPLVQYNLSTDEPASLYLKPALCLLSVQQRCSCILASSWTREALALVEHSSPLRR